MGTISLNLQYKDLEGHPAWLDLLDREMKIIENAEYKILNDDEMEAHVREKLRIKTVNDKKLLNGMKATINTMSVKEQK